MGDNANKSDGDENRQSKWFISISQTLNPCAIEFMAGILSAMGINQNIDIPALASELSAPHP